jgi:solute carrier family 35 protein E1
MIAGFVAVKGSLPLFVVVLSRIFLRQTHTREVYLSLLPIVVGVSLVSFQSPSRNPHMFLGIVFAFISTLNLALLNVFSKKLLSTTFSAISLLHLLTKFSLLIFVPFYFLIMFTHRPEMISWSYMTPQLPFILLLDGALSFRSVAVHCLLNRRFNPDLIYLLHSQNILAFSLLSMCSPLTYSIANCSKRVAIISLSFVVFSVQNLTLQSMSGIAISLLGIFCYNMAKHREKWKKTPEAPRKREFVDAGDATDYDRHSLNSFYNV